MYVSLHYNLHWPVSSQFFSQHFFFKVSCRYSCLVNINIGSKAVLFYSRADIATYKQLGSHSGW